MTNLKPFKTAFSLIELSIVVLIIGILVAGITQSSRLVRAYKTTIANKLSENSPLQTTADLKVWLDAIPASVLTNSSGSTDVSENEVIDFWAESQTKRSNSISSCAQAVNNTNPPTYQYSLLNGLPALRFYAINSNPTRFTCTLDSGINLQNTVFIVFNYQKSYDPSYQAYVLTLSNSSPAVYFALDGNGAGITISTYPGPVDSTYTAFNFINKSVILSRTYDPSNNSSEVFINGTSMTTSTASLSGTTPNQIVIGNGGGGRPFGGDIGEVVIFERVLKRSERQEVEEYLGQKWGIKIN
jgi:prepilin-type N-terminal cleavage/methylation domain-containing protein